MTTDRITSQLGAAILCTVLVMPVISAHASESISEGLIRCSGEADASARLACFDALSRAQEPMIEASTESTPMVPGDQLGAESVRSKDVEKAADVAIKATVTKCVKVENKGYQFHFENGQIWRQTDGKRLKYDSCAFNVTVTKDFFGYKMQEDGQKSRIRVTRVK